MRVEYQEYVIVKFPYFSKTQLIIKERKYKILKSLHAVVLCAELGGRDIV